MGTGEMLGGYNPIAWRSDAQDTRVVVDTKESFIFALDRNLEKNIVSFVDDKMSSTAIIDDYYNYPIFGSGHDLYFGSSNTNYATAKKASYQIPIRNASASFKWDDWEVFLVSKL